MIPSSCILVPTPEQMFVYIYLTGIYIQNMCTVGFVGKLSTRSCCFLKKPADTTNFTNFATFLSYFYTCFFNLLDIEFTKYMQALFFVPADGRFPVEKWRNLQILSLMQVFQNCQQINNTIVHFVC